MIANGYFGWLLKKIGRSKSSNYISLLKTMFEKDFYPVVELDENRAYGGVALRDEYLARGVRVGEDLPSRPCSILEMMIALAIRIDRDILPVPGEEHIDYWFWLMVSNLGLDDMDDKRFDYEKVLYILDRFVGREYDSDGKGGLFPRNKSVTDQREVEIWYQMQGYVMENYDI